MTTGQAEAGQGELHAVIFDVDGTLVDSERLGHRVAFNEAFARAGLPHHWSERHYGQLLAVAGGRQRVSSYLVDNGLDEQEAEDLARELHLVKTDVFRRMALDGLIELRPGVRRLVEALSARAIRLFVATTGSPDWVIPLIELHFGPDTFESVVTGADVHALKPAPDAYRLVLETAGVAPSEAVAVEDSGNGLCAAQSAGLPCLVVRNDYTGWDVGTADLVVDSFGPPATRVSGGRAPLPGGMVTVETLQWLARRPSRR